MPNKGEEITNEPTRTVASKNKGNKVIILVRFNKPSRRVFNYNLEGGII